MKRLMSILLTLVLVLTMIPGMAVTAHADTVAGGECGENLTWSLEDGVLTISGTGSM